MTLKKTLIRNLRNKIPQSILSKIPSRFPIIGRAMLVRLHPDVVSYGKEIGEAILESVKNIESVWAITRTDRIIRRPAVIHLAGKNDPIVIHKELSTLFKLDITKITFSPGNRSERKKLIELIGNSDVIVDLFACVGNLSLPIAVNKNPRIIYCVEINPYAYSFLIENIIMNKVEHKVIPLLGNNLLFKKENVADQILMGYLPEPHMGQVEVAIKVAKRRAIVHYHTLARRGYEKIKEMEIIRKIENRNVNVVNSCWEIIKSYSPAYNHIVIRLHIEKHE